MATDVLFLYILFLFYWLLVLLFTGDKYYIFFGRVVSPLVLGKFVLFFSPNQTEVNWNGACFFGVSYVALSILHSIYEQNYAIIKEELRIEFQTALCSLVYRKSLRLSQKALSDITIGKIVSLISKDINVFGYIIGFASDWCVGVVQIMIIVYLFYVRTGAATFVGFAMLFTTLPVQGESSSNSNFRYCDRYTIIFGNCRTLDQYVRIQGPKYQ